MLKWHQILNNVNTWRHSNPILINAIWFILVIIIFLAVSSYWFRYIDSLVKKTSIESPLYIAGALIGIGWFTLFGINYFYPHSTLAQRQHKWIFVSIVIAAVSFAASFFLLPFVSSITKPDIGLIEYFIILITDFFIVTASLSLAMAIVFIIRFFARI